MADNKNNFIPRSSAIDDSDNANVAKLLPAFYRTDANKKFFKSTLTQLTQPGAVNKISGYIGRQYAKETTSDDVFIDAPLRVRQNYQLEPGFLINDEFENTEYLKDYQDYINQLKVFGANVTNHARINEQEFYSWNPHIDWDKFVNFQNYYWLPNGADTITISTANTKPITSTYKVDLGPETYIFSADGAEQNPTITLYKGYTYYFEVTSVGNPFSIKTARTASIQDRYVVPTLYNNAIETGTIKFAVPANAPSELFYVNENDINFGGMFVILDPDVSGELHVDTEIINKVSYTFGDNIALSNGMKVQFVGDVYPVEYRTGRFYVEGVGESIQLISESQLEIITPYTTDISMLFDNSLFDVNPFSDATYYSGTPDYIVINRGSNDKNAWSRNNRWIHKSVIEVSATANGIHATYNESLRAVRPIIEFEKNLKLFNFGTSAITDVSVIDHFTSDAFSIVEGAMGYIVDGITLTNGQRVIFVSDTDPLVANNVYRVEFIDVKHLSSNSKQIRLVLELIPKVDDVVFIKEGIKGQGTMYWFNGSTWVSCQQKTTVNQPPLFDAYNEDLVSFGDKDVYSGSSFKGTSIFSYKIGTGTLDTNLGFPLSYKNINNIGDIVFNFTLLTESFRYEKNGTTITQTIKNGYLKNFFGYVNGWETYQGETPQAALQLYRNSGKTNNFDLSMYDTKPALLQIRVYVNGKSVSNWNLVNSSNETGVDVELPYYQIVFDTPISETDSVLIKSYSKDPINTNGHYEIPINLQHNPLNGSLVEFTLGEVIDHVDSIVDNLRASALFVGKYPGESNLRDLGSVSKFGTKFVQHSGPASLSTYHITSTEHNIIRAIEHTRDDYCKFKRLFMNVAETLGVDLDTVGHVDLILQRLNRDAPQTSPYYFSDMVPYGAKTRTDFTVVSSTNNIFSLAELFSLTKLSNKAVGVYLNDVQLLHGCDYTFSDQGFVVVSAALVKDDIISIFEYETTDGCLIPETPTKLGMWPKYEPKIYLDTTLVTPKWMIQGHDGSLTVAYNDYRDDLILELEKRIYNNIKIEYDQSIFNINDVVPCYYRPNSYSLKEFNDVLMPNFYKWSSNVGIDFSTPLTYDLENPFTFNYNNHVAPDGQVGPRYWRGIYQWMLGTDRPNLCPWEILGFSEEPLWWESVYGPAPYTRDNLVLWEDLGNGLVNDPAGAYYRYDYAKPNLLSHIPVDSDGNLADPRISNFTSGVIYQGEQGDFTFGDVSPLESAWRRNSHYPFSVIKTAILLKPAKTIGVLLDRSRIKRNYAGQIVYSETGLRIKPSDIILPSIYLSSDRIQTSGLVNFLVNYLNCETLEFYNKYKQNLKLLTSKLCYRVGGFTSKEKFNLLLDSKSPTTVGSVFIPKEDYKVVLNVSSPIGTITYSGVIITKVQGGYEIKGYSKLQPYFKYYNGIGAGTPVNIGGISEGFSNWGAMQTFVAGKIVLYDKKYYRVLVTHVASVTFETSFFASLSELPVVGGVTANFKHKWDRTANILPYGSKLGTPQDVVDFLLGYGQWLIDQGFIFNDFDTDLRDIANWETSAKEFMFWTTNNWKSMQDSWYEWTPYANIKYNDIVRYNGSYYRALKTIDTDIFDINDYELVVGLEIDGSPLISLSPSALKLTFSAVLSVVDDVSNANNTSELFDVSGNQITVPMLQLYRTDNAVSYKPRSDFGIYCATFYLVQREHVVVLNNSTMFNDTIFNLESGYKQDKIKVSGYVSTNWNGSLNVPGFVVDRAKIVEWKPWARYAVGDVVSNRSFYYSAKNSIEGDETFINENWIKLDEKPTSKLIPNWNYKATQFTDFYSLDSENFDVSQQQMAQHLTGYQKRQYLENIIQDDVSEYKFYQGMILEKGTHNVLNKLFDVLSAENQTSLEFYEEWAVRSGQYGACNSFDSIEVVLDESLFKTNPQGFELVNNKPITSDLIIRQTPSDLYVKPNNYDSDITWKAAAPKASSAIYARLDQVKASVKSDAELLTLNSTLINYNEYVLCSFVGSSWNVYQHLAVSMQITLIEANTTGLKFTVIETNISDGDIISVKNTKNDKLNTFFKVKNVTGTTFEIESNTIKPIEETWISIEFGKLVTRKFNTFDSIDYKPEELPTYLKPYNCLSWIDNTNGQWEVWKYNTVYKSLIIEIEEFSGNVVQNIVSDSKGTIIAAHTTDAIFTFKLQRTTSYAQPVRWILKEKIYIEPVGQIAISKDGTWLAATSYNTVYIYKQDRGLFTEVIRFNSPVGVNDFGNSLVFDTTDLYIGTSNTNFYKVSYQVISDVVVAYYNPNGSAGNQIVLSDTTGILEGMTVTGEGFTQNHTVTSIDSDTTITISSVPNTTPSGELSFSTIGWSDLVITDIEHGKLVVAGTIQAVLTDIELVIYQNDIEMARQPFNDASELAITENAEHIAVVRSTQISVYAIIPGVSLLPINQYITGVYTAVKFTIDNTIVAKGNNFVDIFDIYQIQWIFSERIAVGSYNSSLCVTPNNVIVGSSISNTLYHYTKMAGNRSWTVQHRAIPKPDISKIKQTLLYNNVTNVPVKHLDIVDPVQEKFASIIEREVKFKTNYDPAVYSIGTSAVNVDDGIAWAKDQVGVLWWDKRTTKFMDNYTDNVIYRTSSWNQLAPGSSVDVYEWVESDILPASWDARADTEAGLANGISGKSLYGNSVYSVVSKYDTAGQRFVYTYYFWVKNKITISISGRELSAADAASIIANPRGEGYQCLALTGLNSFSLINVKSLLTHTDIVLLVEFWLIDKTDQNIHTQWKLISSSPHASLPQLIDTKWIDSLCGKDEYDRLVPDQRIPVKMRYGIENRPRQSMFVNRFEALKQYFEEVNRILKDELIVDSRDLTNLQKYDTPPSPIRCVYDTVVDTDLELAYVNVKHFIPAEILPVIENGRIIDITIVNEGRGYLTAPFINVYGSGVNAKLKCIISSTGRVTGCIVINSGEGYLDNTTLTIRKFSVLVSSDSQANGKWSIYTYDGIWSKVISQAYDTTQYWNTVDWYAPGYTQFTSIDHSVNTYNDLNLVNVSVGQLVKVLTTTANRWVLLKKYADPTGEAVIWSNSISYKLGTIVSFGANRYVCVTDHISSSLNSPDVTLVDQLWSLLIPGSESIDWTQSYKVVGSQNGTIQFSSLLYSFLNTSIGYDGMLFDSGVFDNYAATELRIILTAIKDDILINELKSKYMSLFFSSIRYALSEQTYIDWIFKTSFVNVVHNVGSLRQPVTYKNDNLSNFEDYVSEVKPYRTQVREYVSSYSSIDNASMSVADFDLPVVYDSYSKIPRPVNPVVKDDYIVLDNNIVRTAQPWKEWYDNVGFTVTGIQIIDNGSEYVSEPTVSIISNSGSGATARAFILNGKINRIKVLTPGKGYLSTPSVIITGGVSGTGTPALASAIIGKGVVRSNLIKLKFDRITQTQVITDLQQVEVIPVSLVTGKMLQFSLKWAPDVTVGSHSVTINGLLEIRDNYKLKIVKSNKNGYAEYSGMIEFSYTPVKGSIIEVTYLKDVSILNAVDRIEHYYEPQTGDLGKDLPQLMTGIDYGGVEISGLSFNLTHGWDSYSFDSIKWDNVNADFNDLKYVYTGLKQNVVIQFPEEGFKKPEVGTLLNVYYDVDPANRISIRLDGVIMDSPEVTGDITEVTIPEVFFNQYFSELVSAGLPITCTFTIREYTSTGIETTETDYDVSISGGTFNTSSAVGLSPEDIIIDGDNFDNIFSGLEEVVPGQVVDTVAITVYTNVNNVVHTYMQFKDMLNRVHYKRLSASKQTTLAVALLNTDTSITLTDVSMLDQPVPETNTPGILQIKGERIEYFTITGNTVSQLRRGTLGTAISTSYIAGTSVQVIGSSETIPYKDTSLVETHTKATNSIIEVNETSTLYNAYGKSIVVNLSFRPNKAKVSWKGTESADIVKKGFGQCNEIEVFVGGYDSSTVWSTSTDYVVDDIVTYGSYTYKCKTAHTSSIFKDDYSNWGVFIGNIRLQKQPYSVYNERLGIEEKFPADFSVNGIYKTVRISQTFKLAMNTIITVVKRTGDKWVVDQTITNFINAVPGVEYVDTVTTFDSEIVTFDNNNIQF